jgi:hypothetical protein
MAVAWRINGALAANATITSLSITAPAAGVIPGDIFIAFCLSKSDQIVDPPIAGWTAVEIAGDLISQELSIYWHRVVAGDPGASFIFTKEFDDNILMCGFIAAFSGCLLVGNPIDAGAPSSSLNASSDTVTYASFDPAETDAFVVAAASYNEDQTAAGAVSGIDPTFTLRADLETAVGTDASMFMSTGPSDGAATGARTQAANSVIDAINIGVLFGLVAEPAASQSGGFLLRGVSPS